MHPRCTSLVLAALVVAGCKSREHAAADTAVIGAATTTPPAAPAPAAAPQAVTVHARDYAFTAPTQIHSGVTRFDFVDDGPGIHHLMIVRLDSGKTFADLQQALKKPGPPPAWMVPVGGPNAPAPKDSSNATLDLAPGNYALMCAVDVPGGVPHFLKGMVAPLTITSATGPAAAMPKADIVITTQEYAFTLSQPLTAGQHTFEVKNAGAQMHEVELIQLAPGKTPQDFVNWALKPAGPPPGKPIGGIAPFVGTGSAFFTADLQPGTYALVCFVPDAKDGKPHFLHGMMQKFTVS